MRRSVYIYFTSQKLNWNSGFEAPENWDELTDGERLELIEQWKQNEIDRFVDVHVEVK